MIPLAMARENWNRYKSSKCNHSDDVVVECQASDPISRGFAVGNIRLLNNSNQIVRSEINFEEEKTLYGTNPNPGENVRNGEQDDRLKVKMGIIRPDMFTVSETQWVTPDKKKGNMLFFKLDPKLVALGPEESFKVRWAFVNSTSNIT